MYKGEGLIVALEGIDGSGKTSHVEFVKTHLESMGRDVLTTKEPGATLIGNIIRSILLDPRLSGNIDPMCELLLYCADRSQHCHEVIGPALQAGKTIVCDRFVESTIAYQGAVGGVSREEIEDIMDEIEEYHIKTKTLPYSHVTLLFDIDPEIAQKRIDEALTLGDRIIEDRFDSKSLKFQKNVRGIYLRIAREAAMEKPCKINIIDASKTPDEVKGQIAAALNKEVAEYNEDWD